MNQLLPAAEGQSSPSELPPCLLLRGWKQKQSAVRQCVVDGSVDLMMLALSSVWMV